MTDHGPEPQKDVSFFARPITRKVGFLLVAVSLVLVVGLYAWYRWNFPYGWSHCCDKQLYFALREYAETHGGAFPAGESTPEASLGLTYGNLSFDCAYLLCGKALSEASVKEILDQGERLGPDSCGWNYVEGLRLGDDSRLALFWDKEGLGHNGQRLPNGGYIVMFLDGISRYIPASDWSAFLSEQEKLRPGLQR